MKLSEKKLLVFDWDGTLWDSMALIIDSIRAVAKDMRLPEPEEQVIRDGIGLPIDIQVAKMFPGVSMVEFRQTFYKYAHKEPACVELFVGAEQLIQDLDAAGYTLAIATSRQRGSLEDALQRTALDKFFVVTRCGDDEFYKPDRRILTGICQELNIAAQDTLMIGDSVHDLELAQNANIDAIAVSYGVGNREVLLAYQPQTCVDNIQELRSLFL